MLVSGSVTLATLGIKNDAVIKISAESSIVSPPNNDGLAFTTFSAIDAEAESYVPVNKVYHKNEAIDLRKNLTALLAANPKSLALNWALVKFYSSAPNYVGGDKSTALRYAANMYSLNYYAGCLAYEHVYNRSYEFSNAESWYKKSLITNLPSGMQWKEFKYKNYAPFGVGVKGSFTNYKIKPLYENYYGTYVRKVMMPVCNGNCEGEIVVDFMKFNKSKANELIITSY